MTAPAARRRCSWSPATSRRSPAPAPEAAGSAPAAAPGRRPRRRASPLPVSDSRAMVTRSSASARASPLHHGTPMATANGTATAVAQHQQRAAQHRRRRAQFRQLLGGQRGDPGHGCYPSRSHQGQIRRFERRVGGGPPRTRAPAATSAATTSGTSWPAPSTTSNPPPETSTDEASPATVVVQLAASPSTSTVRRAGPPSCRRRPSGVSSASTVRCSTAMRSASASASSS